MTGRGSRLAAAHRVDAGSAVIEFVTLGMLLLLPLMYLVVTLGRIQAATYAADGSARAAARAYVVSDSDADGAQQAAAAVRLGLLDQGFDIAPADALRLECSADPCLTPGARVAARVEVTLSLPGIPSVVDDLIPTRLTVSASSVAAVDRFRAPRP